MQLLTADLADGIRWLADLLPLFATLLGVLVLFELAIVLGSVIATLEERSARRRSEETPAAPPRPVASVSPQQPPSVSGSRERTVRALWPSRHPRP